MDAIRAAKKKHTAKLLKKKNVVGVAIGYKNKGGKWTTQKSVVVLVTKKENSGKLKKKDLVPKTVGGIATDVVEVGEIKPLQTRKDKWRPAPGGVSIGHPDITAGTLGCLVERDEQVYILSNNHVMADCNHASVYDHIYQPGTADGGTDADTIAFLSQFVPINFSGGDSWCPFAKVTQWIFNAVAWVIGARTRLQAKVMDVEPNLVDAAIAIPNEEGNVVRNIYELGIPTGSKPAELGMRVTKSGRTTAVTEDVVTQIDATIIVNYGADGQATFEDQIITGFMSEGGDSGSALLCKEDLKVVGLLFAGSSTITIHNKIENVLSLLNVVISV